MSKCISGSVRQCVVFLEKIDYLRQASILESLSLNADFMSVAFRTKNYYDVYDVAVETQCFNFVMSDGSFFQFTEVDRRSSRYCFYPNPYSFEEYLRHKSEIEKISLEEEMSWEECEQILTEGTYFNIDVPCIRFDKDYDAYSEDYHPVAHFHVGFFSDNRWPVKRILTPYAFFLFIFRTYYREKWLEYENKNDVDLDIEFLSELDRTCFVEDEFFTEKERRRIHIT